MGLRLKELLAAPSQREASTQATFPTNGPVVLNRLILGDFNLHNTLPHHME